MFKPPRYAKLIKPLAGNWFSGIVTPRPRVRYRDPLKSKKALSAQREYLKQLRTLSNDDLFELYERDMQPDDYDGGMTPMGQWMAAEARKALVDRLAKIRFLKG